MRGSSLSLKRVDNQDSHPGQANMLLLLTYIIDGCPSKSSHPFLKKWQAEQYKSSSTIKVPLLLPQTDLRHWICRVRKSSHFSVVGGTGRGTRTPQAQGAAALTKAPLVWQSGTANRISESCGENWVSAVALCIWRRSWILCCQRGREGLNR